MSGEHQHGFTPLLHAADDHADLPREEEEVDSVGPAWLADNVQLTTVGVDIGSSTSHVMFARLHLRRLTQGLSSRFVVVGRTVLHQSSILLTPYRADNLIDVEALARFLDAGYREAGLSAADVDTGAVILTGVALERANARALAELFAREGGKFVCASAGHRLEALLAAHGSGAVARSRQTGETVLNVDIGGGTTKLALVSQGEIVSTLAVAVGARLVAFDGEGRVERVEASARRFAGELGIPLQPGQHLAEGSRRRLVESMARVIVDAACGQSQATHVRAAWLAGDLQLTPAPDAVTFSGGMAEYLYGRETRSYGDLAEDLAAALRAHANDLPAPVTGAGGGIRATVVGASQFSVQLSGNTIHVSRPELLPIRNVPTVALPLPPGALSAHQVERLLTDRLAERELLASPAPIALAISWSGEPLYENLRALAEGIHRVQTWRHDGSAPVVLALRSDLGATLGEILAEELGARYGVVAVDTLELLDLDFIDIGQVVWPANVVPVIVKSLVFPQAV